MSKIGVATARKTKFNPTTNNPFQGPTTVNFQSTDPETRGSPFICFTDPFDPTSPMVKNSTTAFVINRVGGGATYGDNRRLYIGVAQAQNLDSKTGYNILFGVNNNGALAPSDGLTIVRISATDRSGDPVVCLGRDDGPATNEGEGLFTKLGAGDLTTPVILADGDNFKFSFNQALEAAAPGNPPELYQGKFFIPQSFIDAIPNPGDEIELTLTITMVYNTTSTGGVDVVLEDAGVILRLINS
jgi:hypothetical protein